MKILPRIDLVTDIARLHDDEPLFDYFAIHRNCDATISSTHAMKYLKTLNCHINSDIKRLGLWDNNILLGQEFDLWHPLIRDVEIGSMLARRIMEQPRGQVTILTSQASIIDDRFLEYLPPERMTVMFRFGIPVGRDDIRKAIDPDSSSILERLEAIRFCHKAGIRVTALVDSIMPSIGDSIDDINTTFHLLRQVGVQEIRLAPLRMHDPQTLAIAEKLELAGLPHEAECVRDVYFLQPWNQYYENLLANARNVAASIGMSKQLHIVFPKKYVKEASTSNS